MSVKNVLILLDLKKIYHNPDMLKYINNTFMILLKLLIILFSCYSMLHCCLLEQSLLHLSLSLTQFVELTNVGTL